MSEPRLCTVLIPAVGGQGGGVLSEWLVEAAAAEGHAVHGTSIPGVAQRTGSTSYYLELWTGPEAEAPVFSLYPVPGAVDVLLAPEFLEVGRSIELGFPSPERTTIVASTHRLYSIHEKIATGRGIQPFEELERAARAFARTLVAFDALAVAREHGTEVNAVLLGALAASGALPIGAAAYRTAIERKGVAVAVNLAGFDLGRQLAERGVPPPVPPAARPPRTPPAFAVDAARLAPGLRPIVGDALTRLIDYQDERYARRYLERLAAFLREDDRELARLVARYLAVWMTYEDAIRVADLKTRASRFERIRSDVRAGDAEVVVTDYLKPDLDELYGLLPHRLVAPFARWAERRWPHGRPTPGQQVRTTTVLGFLRLWLLARCRRLRPVSYRARQEHARMERWLDAVGRAAGRDEALGCEVARAAQLVKGYGDVRRRMTAAFDDLLDAVEAVAALEAEGPGGFELSAGLARAYRTLVLQGPEHEDEARRLAAEVRQRLAAGDRSAALAKLDRALAAG
jgi:indolepyruvate ferredoxin oxidoreductase, beta subunit